MSVIRIKNLRKTFGSTVALDNISFSVEKGEIFGFLGPNGAGKSTTLRCIMDYTRPKSGSITVLGKDSTLDSDQLKACIAYVPAEPNLYQNWSVDQHLAFMAKLRPIDYDYAAELKSQLSLDGKIKVRHLSTGNQQKIAIVLALACRPEVLLLDEPTRGLDPLLRSTLHDLLRAYQKSGGTVLLSSHDLSEVEELCSQVVIIKSGKLVTDTSIEKLKKLGSYKVRISFGGKVPELASIAENIVVTGKSVSLSIKGDINPLISKLDNTNVKDIEISGSNLEDIFMELYK